MDQHECLYKACQAAMPDGGLFTDTGGDERDENERHSGNDYGLKQISICSSKVVFAVRRTMFTVAVEGNIGSGKSTFLNYFQQFPSVIAMQEPVEQWTSVGGHHNALNLLYKDPSRWSYLFNQYAMLSRLKQHKQNLNCSVKLMERSLFSTQHVFVKNSHKSGSMTDLEYAVATEWFDYLVSSENIRVDLFVYLRVLPDVCLQRIHNRGRQEEYSLSLEFLTRLHELHESMVSGEGDNKSLPAPVLVLDASLELSDMYQVYTEKRAEILRGYA